MASSTTIPTTFAERLAQRRQELVEKTSVVLPIPGYEGLYGRYRVLGYEDIRNIGLRAEQEAQSVADGERNTAADTLTEACEELMQLVGHEDDGAPIFQSLNYRWTAKAAGDLFGVDLPEGAIGVTALKAIFPYPHDMLMMRHFQEYLSEADLGIGEIEEKLMGELPVPSVGT